MEKEGISKKQIRSSYPIIMEVIINSVSDDNLIVVPKNIVTEYYTRSLHIPPTSIIHQTPEICIYVYFDTYTSDFCMNSIRIKAKNFFTDVYIDSIKIQVNNSKEHVFSYQVSKSIEDIIILTPLCIDTFHKDVHLSLGFHKVLISMIIYDMKSFSDNIQTQMIHMFMMENPP